MKKFLAAFAGISAAFASSATTMPTAPDATNPIVDSKNVSKTSGNELGGSLVAFGAAGDEYKFVLKRSEETGLMMAMHSSHSSHSSHRSHYSSR
jgi:hypothetical protein